MSWKTTLILRLVDTLRWEDEVKASLGATKNSQWRPRVYIVISLAPTHYIAKGVFNL